MSSFIVKCQSCGTGNRIPEEKEGLKGHCGNCHATLPALYFRPQRITNQTFDDFVTRYNGPVLAEFWAPW